MAEHTPKTPKLCSFGLGGDSVTYTGGSRGSGYGTPENPHSVKPTECADGTPCIDKRTVLERNPGLAIRSPMCSADLADEGINRCPAPSKLFAQAVEGNSYGTLLDAQQTHQETSSEPGPLDTISVSAYVKWWRDAGARIGQIIDHKIIWED